MSAVNTPLLVTPEWLHAHLDDPSVRVLDCTTWMTPQPVGPSTITSGKPDWLRAHIPGSDHVCMVHDLSDPAGAFPYTLPADDQIAALLSRLGIGNAHHVVLYGAAQPMVVTRAWWVLTALGLPRVSVLDGGLPRWRREGRPLTDAVTTRAPAAFQPRRDAAMVADASAEAGITRRRITDDELRDRLILPMVNEGAKLLEEGVAARASDIDVVWQRGYGWPAWKGGPMYTADRIGLAAVHTRLLALQAQHGERFRPAALLAKLAAAGGRFIPDAD